MGQAYRLESSHPSLRPTDSIITMEASTATAMVVLLSRAGTRTRNKRKMKVDNDDDDGDDDDARRAGETDGETY